MEKIFKLKGTEDTPEVVFNRETNEFCLSGRSLPEDAYAFYRPIVEWMSDYVKQPNTSSELKIFLEYFNSSSVKQVLGMISIFEEIIKTGKEAKIIWCYSLGDDLMEIKGQEFESMVKEIKFEFKTY
jgi:hypothetical protein